MPSAISFSSHLEQVSAEGGYPTDDVLRMILPLMEQVQKTHEAGKVAPLEGMDRLFVSENGLLGFPDDQVLAPKLKSFELVRNALEPVSGVEVVAESRQVTDLSEERVQVRKEEISEAEALIRPPKFLQGYACWEHQAGQHDPVTDVFSLGLILASLACGLDLGSEDDFQIFIDNRTYLFAVNSRLNPVVASAIVQMTELQRNKRAQDLPSLIRRLQNYREQPTEYDFDFQRLEGFKDSNLTGKRRLIQSHLRDRLFEISRRNRLLYFKPTRQQVNLTLASVPSVLDYKNIRHDQLFVWHQHLSGLLVQQSVIPLNRFVRFEDAPYVPELLEKIISEAKRDRAEYGFAQLKLVVCFLRWNNLKEAPQERIVSPLLLLPVELNKKKGIRDSFSLQATSRIAEVNPVLRHHFRQLYNLDLPEAIDLEETTLDKFHEFLAAQIQSSEQAVTLRKVDKPQIELIHQKARQRLDQYRRRQKLSARSASGYAKLQHSYRRENLKPMGLQIFLQKVKPPASPFEGVLGDITTKSLPGFMVAPAVEPAPQSGKVLEKERLTYSLKGPDDENPYLWIFDLCNITLGNFNYRKMSLVSDYNQLVDLDIPNPAFDRVFSLQPKSPPRAREEIPLGDLYTVVACDPTQAGAIAQARQSESFIIQGPPGTGKSQTITNLVADYIAQGKRVLFVCEKRAAIDVVYHRLRQQGLDELCCLIHDSQTDKKAFIQDLSRTYEKLLNHPADLEQAERERAETVREIEQHLNALSRFEDAMKQVPESAGLSVRQLLRKLVELREHLPELSDLEDETLPVYREWRDYGHLLARLSQELSELGEDPRWAVHTFRRINPEVFQADRPLDTIRRGLSEVEPLVDHLQSAVSSVPLFSAQAGTFQQFADLMEICRRLRPLAERNLFDLLDARSSLSGELDGLVRGEKEKEAELEKASRLAEAWIQKLSPENCDLALSQAESFERKIFPWLSPDYWRLRKILKANYDFAKHPIRRSPAAALRELRNEQRAESSREDLRGQIETRFGTADAAGFLNQIRPLREAAKSGNPALKNLVVQLRKSDSGAVETLQFLEASADFDRLSGELGRLLVDYAGLSWPDLKQMLADLQSEMPLLRELAGPLGELRDAPAGLVAAFRQIPLTPEQLESALARKSLSAIYREDRFLSRFEGRILREKIGFLQVLYQRLLALNGRVIAARQQARFMHHVNISGLPASQLTGEQKLFKKTYSTGRRELEHEFGKSMRYRAIRELAAGASGKVLADLKPVWLMSPLSVSDTLPLEPGHFDVVIFDEASQIPVEDAVPALYRAAQVIVVGDEMQLPPTKFFASSAADDETLVVEEDEEKIEVSLEADSFLTQSAINLPSTMLGWHYRSRSEALIGFSNAAFYRGELLTIPDRSLPRPGQREIVAGEGSRGEDFVEALLDRSLSFHFQQAGVYEDRRNRKEADYIAGLVRGLLLRRTGKSLGLVAFSEAQQTEIENALKRLGQEDEEFRELFERELEREEEDQFCGLFIKNLENVQGDERDIILLSVCYGYDRNRRMLMNFGPINQRGGEKRLNVIFSRAREHMAIVSSIRYADVKNEYNDGANSLRLFLHYSEAFSKGEWETARRILTNLNPQAKKALSGNGGDIVSDQIARGLRQRGWQVDAAVGQSRFRCDLAIRDPESPGYMLGLFVDSDERVADASLLERAVFQPRVLSGFGWRFAHVLTKDWFHDPQAVLDRLERCWKDPEPGPLPLPATLSQEKPVELKASPIEDEKTFEESTPSLETAELPVEENQPLDNPPEPAVSREVQLFGPENLVEGQALRWELADGKSNKFWEIIPGGKGFTIRYGRIGTVGQSQTKTFADETVCHREAFKLIQEKIRKGYLKS